MTVSYSQNKEHIYKWRNANRSKLNEINKKSTHKAYQLKRELKIFREILLE